MQNRLTPPSRWPLDLAKRIERAETDLAFAATMTEIMGETPELHEIALRAMRQYSDATRALDSGPPHGME